MPTYKYGAVERATAAAMNIEPDAMGAFRARIRHMRTLGVPAVKFVRSGVPAEYSRENAIELLLTLKLQKLGQTPKSAKEQTRSIMRTCDISPAGGGEHTFAVFETAETPELPALAPGYTVCVGRKVFLDWCESATGDFISLNVTAAVAAIDEALGTPDPSDDEQRQEE